MAFSFDTQMSSVNNKKRNLPYRFNTFGGDYIYRNREEKTLQHAFHAKIQMRSLCSHTYKKLPNSILNGAYQLYLKA